MNDNWKDLLASWEVSDPDPELKYKVLDMYRKQFPKRSSIWRGLISTRIAIPLPVAATTVLLLVAMSYFAARPQNASSLGERQMVSEIQHPREMPRDAEMVRSSLPATQPTKATGESPQSVPSKVVRTQAARKEQRISTIILQGEQETIQCLAGTEYRPIAVPKIYAGLVFDASEVR